MLSIFSPLLRGCGGEGLSAHSSAAALCAIRAERLWAGAHGPGPWLWAGALGPGPWLCAGHDSRCMDMDLGGTAWK